MSRLVFRPQIHEKLKFLLFDNSVRYKVAHGGRGGGKSYSFADAALARMISEKLTITVCRELDTSIKDSVHKLIIERIDYHNLRGIFKISDQGFTCANGSILNYKHLHNNVTEIKGLQKTKICWIFEAESLKKESFDILDPTIREPGSEIWIEFNADSADDFVYDFFVVNTPDNCKVVKLIYTENPMCPQTLIDQAEACKKRSLDDYRHIWLGEPSNVGSKIYPMFDENVHVRYFDLEKFRITGNFFMGQDPATVYFPFGVWIARVEKQVNDYFYVVYNEFPTVNMMGGKLFHEIRTEKVCTLTLKQRANMFRVLDRTVDKSYNWIEMTARGIDTRFVKASGAASTTLATRGLIHTMADESNGGMMFETPPESMIDVQRDNLRSLMDYNVDLGIVPGFNEPKFFVMPHCHNVIDSLNHHRVDRAKKTEDQKRKDAIDAIRITLAVMGEHQHKNRTVGAPAVFTGKSKTDEMVEMWLNR